MELFEQIRREYEFGAGTIQGVAQKLGVHRRMVREASGSAVPARRKKNRRPHVKMAPAADFIDAILEVGPKAPRKQRHTARRIYERIRREIPDCTAAERTVRQDGRNKRKQARAAGVRVDSRRSSHRPGIEAQVDGMKLMPIWLANGSSFRYFRCARWPAERPIIGPICEPRSRHF